VTLGSSEGRRIDFRKVLADTRVEEDIQDAYHYEDNLKKIRQKASRIVTNAEGITKDAKTLDDHLKECLKELQLRISEAVQEIQKKEIP
jgi:F0F1-type ATP synthase membrane subunit b/b'